jgi:acyl carrier protein
MSDEIERSVREVVIELFLDGDHSYPLEPDTSLIESGITDSMGLVQLAAALEARFAGVRIQDQDVNRDNLGCIAAIAGFLRRSVAA